MIVKNEASVIQRCLASVRPYIDHWVIVDTGSTDGTQQLIRDQFADIPGVLHERPWVDFGYNRNEALQLAKDTADYLLFIDADEQLGAKPGFKWPVQKEPAFSLEARFSELSYDRVSLVSTQYPWQWKGVLHEYLDAGQAVRQPRIPGIWIQVTTEGARSKDSQKFQKDAAVLEAALQHEPDNTRYVFYLAQSYRDAGLLEPALANYARRAGMGGWDEEAWYALLEVAQLTERLGRPHEQIVAAYLHAYQVRPTRAETLTALAKYLRGRSEWNTAYLFAQVAAQTPDTTDRLFVDVTAYRWRAKDELALAAFYTGRKDQARTIWRKLLTGVQMPEPDRARIQNNLTF